MTYGSPASRPPENDPRWKPTQFLPNVARFLNRTYPKTYATVSLLPRLIMASVWLRRLERDGLGKRLSRLPIGEHRTSDTVFVLGTGASINSYTSKRWEVVRAHDSIGMNFFLLHEHVPTFHVMEDVHGLRADLLRYRYAEKGDFHGVPLILKTQLTNLSIKRVNARAHNLAVLDEKVRANTYFSLDVLVAASNAEELDRSYRISRGWGMWKTKPRFLVLTKQGGSISYIVNLAVRAGYRRVVLCGVDLNHSEYFYDSRRSELEAIGVPVPVNDQTGVVHDTNDPAQKPLTMHQIILAMKRTVLDPAGVELMVGAETSALYPDLPRFDWERSFATGA
jgi:hypothetical protein